MTTMKELTITLTRTIEVPLYEGDYEVVDCGYERDAAEDNGKGEYWEEIDVSIDPKTAAMRVIEIPRGWDVEYCEFN